MHAELQIRVNIHSFLFQVLLHFNSGSRNLIVSIIIKLGYSLKEKLKFNVADKIQSFLYEVSFQTNQIRKIFHIGSVEHKEGG